MNFNEIGCDRMKCPVTVTLDEVGVRVALR